MVVSSHLRATSAPKCLPSLTSMAFSVHQYATVTTTNWKRNALFQECKASMSVHNVKKANLFAARKQRIKLPSSYDGCRISEFLREPSGTQAVLNTSALQDFQTLDTNTYRCFLPKLQLLNFEAAPVLDLRVTPTEEDCTVEMLSCKFGNCSWIPSEFGHVNALVIDRSEKNFYVFSGKRTR
ncbi:hypothetical protein K2173_003615 [Erythroxylum novogranatense]|uniref:Uncharacterized protein n=1 Tax=Erythroxylum novogranatense TaxID=1862640 RepID=A0AAV8TCJ3_9ROSI|nr:hypothetical protein K2173_003615 [Erythroxylum novogranatense]